MSSTNPPDEAPGTPEPRRGRPMRGRNPTVTGRTSSSSPRRGSPRSPRSSPNKFHHSPEPANLRLVHDKSRIFSSTRRGKRPGHQPRPDIPKVAHATDLDDELKSDFDTTGTSGKAINLVTNYFKVTKNPGWSLFQYRAEFFPTEDDRFIRKAYLSANKKAIGAYIFDGTKLFTARKLPVEGYGDIVTFDFTTKNETRIKIELKYQGQTEFGDPVYLQFYNLIVRKCLFGMGLEEMGRNFYDNTMAIDFPCLKIQLWPGYITSLRNHEDDILLCVEVTHKVIQTQDVLSVIRGIQSSGQHQVVKGAILKALQESIVMTEYNRTTYRVQGVDFDSTPRSSFAYRDKQMITYMDYYRSKYHIEIRDCEQPLLNAKQTKYDPRAKEKDEGIVTLIPELCQFTGLSESMRSNFSVMRELSRHLHMSPGDRIRSVNGFMTRLQGSQNLVQELAEWGFVFQTELLRCQGRVLPKENITFAHSGVEIPNDQADWSKAFRSHKLLQSVPLNNWIILVTRRDAGGIHNLLQTMQKVSRPLGFEIQKPTEVINLPDNKTQTYVKTIDQIVQKKAELQMVFVVLPTSGPECYAAVKKRLVVDYGIPSQCFLAKNLKSKGLMSIATKMCVQMCTKLGGEPWKVTLPLKTLMVIGFDTYGKKSPQVSSMVSSVSSSFTKYFSTVSFSSSTSEKVKNICVDIAKCIQAYKTNSLKLPGWILIYRDGIGEGPDAESEAGLIERSLLDLYKSEEIETPPKFTYVLISKRINTRLMADRGGGRVDNVPPGTILDHTITLPDRYDFFLVSANSRQGTSSPCSYNVLRDTSDIEADKLQLITHKLCHLYFNWSGTVAVPAPCQYAHKLAALTAVAYDRSAHSNLSELLYYL